METTFSKYIETYGLFTFQALLLMLILVSKYVDKVILESKIIDCCLLEVSQSLQNTGSAYRTLGVVKISNGTYIFVGKAHHVRSFMKQKKDIPVRTLPKEYGSGLAVAKVSAETFLADDETMHAHRHDYHFFVLQEKGITHTEIDFEQYLLTTPTILYQSPNQVHRALKVENIDMYMLIISNENIHPDYLKLLQSIAPLKPLSIEAKELAIVRRTFDLCIDLHERTADKLYFSSLKDTCNALIGLMISLYLKQAKPVESLSRFERITNDFLRLLEQHFLKIKRPSAFAEALHISVSYLNECVKSVTGQPVSYHIQQRIILEAKRLLYHSDKSVKEIAAELGYDDYPYFSRLFTKTTGMTAVTFRGRNRE